MFDMWFINFLKLKNTFTHENNTMFKGQLFFQISISITMLQHRLKLISSNAIIIPPEKTLIDKNFLKIFQCAPY